MHRRRTVPLLLFALAAVLALACRALAGAPPTATAAPEGETRPTLPAEEPVGAGDYELDIVHEGESREIIVHLPTGYDEDESYPLVIVLHGGGGNAAQVQRVSRMDEAADTRGFIVVYPNGSGPLEERLFTWNAGHCCGFALEHGVDDVAFLDFLIDHLGLILPVDAGRIYMTGISNGGMMAYSYAAQRPERLAGVAPIAGTIGGQAPGSDIVVSPQQPGQPVPLMAFHGLQDMNVPYAGGSGSRSVEPGRVDLSVEISIGFWVAANGCDPQPELEEQAAGNIRIERYGNCQEGAEVLLVTIVDGGHAWPGGRRGLISDAPTSDISASEMMLDFFLEHGN